MQFGQSLALSGAGAPALPEGEPRRIGQFLASPFGRGVPAGDGEGEDGKREVAKVKRFSRSTTSLYKTVSKWTLAEPLSNAVYCRQEHLAKKRYIWKARSAT